MADNGGKGGRPKGRKDGPGVKRKRRTAAEMALEHSGLVTVATRSEIERAKGDGPDAVDILRLIYRGQPVPGCEQMPPYRLDVMAKAATAAAPYERPRLSSVEVKDDADEQRKRIEFIEGLHKKALEGNARAEERYAEAKAAIEKLGESDAAILRKALGIFEPVAVDATGVEK